MGRLEYVEGRCLIRVPRRMLHNHSIQSESSIRLKQLICRQDRLLVQVSLNGLIERRVIVIVFLLHRALQIVLFHKGRTSDKR